MKQCFMFYHLPNPDFYATRPKLCWVLRECSVMKQGSMFYVLPSTWPNFLFLSTKSELFLRQHSVMKQSFIFHVLPFAKLNPCSPRQKLKLAFDVTFLHETLFYVLPSTQICTPLDQSCTSFWESALSWNKVLCFMFYHLPDQIFNASWLNLNSFWGNALSWNNVLYFMYYHLQNSILFAPRLKKG